jgi:hypothetical protein
MAGSRTRQILGVFFVGTLAVAAPAQRTTTSSIKHATGSTVKAVSEPTSSGVLTPDEGLAILGAALETRNDSRPKGDCSHLVHEIYERAGFSYSYADSSQLYDGTEDFQRVTHAQPGDLAVWRGHAAIVVNPAQHSFFSATRSGLRVESYDLEYWKRRGAPRFFRYVKSPSRGSASVTRTAKAKPPTPAGGASHAVPAALSGSGDPPADDPPASGPPLSATPGVRSLPRIVVVHASQPNPKQVNETLPQHFAETSQALRDQDVLKLGQQLIVFDHIEVKHVQLKGSQGWAAVKIDGLNSLAAGRAAPKKKVSEQQRWVLTRRDAETWELLLPLKDTYLPHDLAVRVFAHQLASLADRAPEGGDSSRDQAQLARVLNVLLQK